MKRRTAIGKRAPAIIVLSAWAALTAPAQTFTTLFSFDGTNGEYPSGLVQAINGDLYGTTSYGGAASNGTVFKITPGGELTTFYSFCSLMSCADGHSPEAGLVQATNGDVYGTTARGGALGSYGTLFKMTLSGDLTTLYTFCSLANCADGEVPEAVLIQANNGELYGTTVGEYYDACSGGCGTVFKVTQGGTLTTLYSFCSMSNCADGYAPHGGLVQAANGEIYGTTSHGGAHNGGTVFKITPDGALTTLYSFCSLPHCADGGAPEGELVQAANGDLYGTTHHGGAQGDHGTVFQITPGGALTTLYSFCSLANCADGKVPFAGLVQATNGELYGTTYDGGAHRSGTLFQITPGGALTTLYSFCSLAKCADGSHPEAVLVQATNGDLYGTTGYGGASDWGIVFSLSLGLGPFVKSLPTAAPAGAAVKILGTDLTGATSVTFNGTAAVFTVDAPTLITTTVPAGATTGEIKVVTPSGTLSSNVPFHVLP